MIGGAALLTSAPSYPENQMRQKNWGIMTDEAALFFNQPSCPRTSLSEPLDASFALLKNKCQNHGHTGAAYAILLSESFIKHYDGCDIVIQSRIRKSGVKREGSKAAYHSKLLPR